MSCVALSSTNCNLGKLMRITSPLTIHGLCFHQRSFVVCAPLPKKKKSCILPLGYFISNTDFLFFPTKITQGITVVILRTPLLRLLENTRTRDWRALGKRPMIWSHILHHASIFATPHVNFFSLCSVDVIQFIEVSRYMCPRFHLVISHLYLSVISKSRTQWQISAYFPIYWNNSYQLDLGRKLLQINDITT